MKMASCRVGITLVLEAMLWTSGALAGNPYTPLTGSGGPQKHDLPGQRSNLLKPKPSDTASTSVTYQSLSTATFTVRASGIGAGVWNPTSLQAQTGQWVTVEITPLDELKDPKAEPAHLEFRTQGADKPSCSVSFDNGAKAGLTQTKAFSATSSGRIQYATEGKLSVKVVLTLSFTRPEGASGGGGGGSGDTHGQQTR